MSKKKLPIKHIGIVIPICGIAYNKDNRMFHMGLREDLGHERYAGLGVKERFKDEKPYRICKRCLAIIFRKENKYNPKYKHKSWSFYYKKKENKSPVNQALVK